MLGLPPNRCEQRVCSLHDWATLRSELLFIYDSPIPPGMANGGGERSGELSAWLLRKGEVSFQVDGKNYHAKEGEWVLCFGREIEQQFSDQAHLLSLRFLHGWVDGKPLFKGEPVQILRAANYPILETGAMALLKVVSGVTAWQEAQKERDPRDRFLWQNQLDYPTYLEYEVRLREWMKSLTECMIAEGREIEVPGRGDQRVAKVFSYLDSLGPGAPFPERELMAISGLTLGRLNRLALEVYGMTTYAYWEMRRVERAKLLLELGELRVKEVASELGFVQLSHFSAWFKRHCDRSPRAFRDEAASRASRR